MICQPAPISLHQYKPGKLSFFDKSLNIVSSNSSFPLCLAFSTSFVTSLDAISKPNSVSTLKQKSEVESVLLAHYQNYFTSDVPSIVFLMLCPISVRYFEGVRPFWSSLIIHICKWNPLQSLCYEQFGEITWSRAIASLCHLLSTENREIFPLWASSAVNIIMWKHEITENFKTFRIHVKCLRIWKFLKFKNL